MCKKWVPGSLPGVKQPGRDGDHSAPPTFQRKNEYMYMPSWRGQG
jgi:hypothetical protein